MNRLTITASATAIAAAVSMASAAEAGKMRFGFGLPIGVVHGGHTIGSSSYYEAQRLEAERRAEAAEAARLRSRQKAAAAAAAAAAAKKKALAIAEAKVKAADEAAQSPPATGATGPVKTAEAGLAGADIANAASGEAASQPGCKRYFAHVGLTVSVPCAE